MDDQDGAFPKIPSGWTPSAKYAVACAKSLVSVIQFSLEITIVKPAEDRNVNHALDFRSPVGGLPGQHFQIWKDLRLARAMRVAAQNKHLKIRMGFHRLPKSFACCLAREER